VPSLSAWVRQIQIEERESMWIVLTVIAAISMVVFFMRGPNAVWGGATLGIVVGIIIAIFGDGFDWSIIWKAIVVGTLAGVVAELLGEMSTRLKRKL